jgi:hypothetical protein
MPDETQPAVAHWAAAGLAAGPNWWDRYSGLFPGWFGTYMSMEQAAQSMWIYEQQFIPGLLQTEKYTAAVVSLGNCTAEQASQLVELRKERQRRFRDGKMKLRVILDEGPPYRRAHLTKQLRHPQVRRRQHARRRLRGEPDPGAVPRPGRRRAKLHARHGTPFHPDLRPAENPRHHRPGHRTTGDLKTAEDVAHGM